jgi:hypothetical protein
MKSLNRKVVKVLHRNGEADGYVEGSLAYCFASVWEITKDVYSFAGSGNAERRLQRNVTNFIRRKS